MQAYGADVRSVVRTPSRAKVGASQLGGGGSGGFGDGGEGGSPTFSDMLTAKFGATMQQDAERQRTERRRRLAVSSPTLSSPTHSAPPSPPQSPPADGSSPGGRPSLGGRPSGKSGRFNLSRPTRNSSSARTSTASSEPEASPGGTPDGKPTPRRRQGGLTRQATVGRVSRASAKLADAMKCVITVNEGGELQRAAGGKAPHHVTVTLESPSRHLQKAIEILLVAIAAAKKAGVDAAEQEAARLWLKDLQEAEAKVR